MQGEGENKICNVVFDLNDTEYQRRLLRPSCSLLKYVYSYSICRQKLGRPQSRFENGTVGEIFLHLPQIEPTSKAVASDLYHS
jgi:hypothetical protein